MICERNLQVGEKKKVLRRSNAQKMNCNDLYLTLNHSSQRFWPLSISSACCRKSYYLYNCRQIILHWGRHCKTTKQTSIQYPISYWYKNVPTRVIILTSLIKDVSAHCIDLFTVHLFTGITVLIKVYIYSNQGVLMKNLY